MSEHEPQPEGDREPEGAAEDQEREHETARPRVWVGSLADYNNGVLHGQWLEAARAVEDLEADVRAMLERSKQPDAEEWGIFDYDGFGAVRLGEYERLDVVARVARGIVEHGLAFAAWAELHDCDPAMLENFEDSYLGAYQSLEAWVQAIVDDLGVEASIAEGLPELIAGHVSIDLAGMADDLVLSGDVWIEDNAEGGVWVFDARG